MLKGDREHRRGRRLAVGAGDRHPATSGHQRGQGVRTLQHRGTGRERRDHLRVVQRDGAGDHNGVDARDVASIVADVDGRPESPQGSQRA